MKITDSDKQIKKIEKFVEEHKDDFIIDSIKSDFLPEIKRIQRLDPSIITSTTIIRPTAFVQLIDMLHINRKPETRMEVWDGKEVEAVTYKHNNPDFTDITFYYPGGYRDSEAFKIIGSLCSFCEENGIIGTEKPVIFNEFLDWLEYKRDKDNTHDINTKKKIWKSIYYVYQTNIRAEFGIVIKNKTQKSRPDKAIFDGKSVIDFLVGIYTRNGRDVQAKDYEETPPDKILVRFIDLFIDQLKGKQLKKGDYISRDVTVAPKIPATLWNTRYQGDRRDLLDYIFLELRGAFSLSGIRNYRTEDLVKRGSNIKRHSMAVDKTIQHLEIFEQDKHIKSWGFRSSQKGKQLGKQYKKSSIVWIDFNDTDTFKRVEEEFRGIKLRGKKARQTEQIKDLQNSVKKLQKTNEEYGIK
ncbi:MAG: hypothetical protein ACR2LN_01100 [Candidatus Levyibacteriota bacterium]